MTYESILSHSSSGLSDGFAADAGFGVLSALRALRARVPSSRSDVAVEDEAPPFVSNALSVVLDVPTVPATLFLTLVDIGALDRTVRGTETGEVAAVLVRATFERLDPGEAPLLVRSGTSLARSRGGASTCPGVALGLGATAVAVDAFLARQTGNLFAPDRAVALVRALAGHHTAVGAAEGAPGLTRLFAAAELLTELRCTGLLVTPEVTPVLIGTLAGEHPAIGTAGLFLRFAELGTRTRAIDAALTLSANLGPTPSKTPVLIGAFAQDRFSIDRAKRLPLTTGIIAIVGLVLIVAGTKDQKETKKERSHVPHQIKKCDENNTIQRLELIGFRLDP